MFHRGKLGAPYRLNCIESCMTFNDNFSMKARRKHLGYRIFLLLGLYSVYIRGFLSLASDPLISATKICKTWFLLNCNNGFSKTDTHEKIPVIKNQKDSET